MNEQEAASFREMAAFEGRMAETPKDESDQEDPELRKILQERYGTVQSMHRDTLRMLQEDEDEDE